MIPKIAPPSSLQTLLVEINGSKIYLVSIIVGGGVVQLSVSKVDVVQLLSTAIVEASLSLSIILHWIFSPSSTSSVFVVLPPGGMINVP